MELFFFGGKNLNRMNLNKNRMNFLFFAFEAASLAP